MSTTILVTGCAGFIGSNFSAEFHRQFPASTIVGLDDLSTGKPEAIDPSVVFYKGSITSAALVEKIFSKHKPEYVFHFAALPRVSYSIEHPRETSEVNIGGTITLLEASKKFGVKRFVFSSSSAIYGNIAKLPTKEYQEIYDPQSPYAVQKYSGELFCAQFSKLFGLDTVSLRYFNVYGPGQYGDSPYSTVIASWLEGAYFKRSRPYLEGTGKQSRDFCYVADVVAANILAMQCKQKLSGMAVNIGSGKVVTIAEVKTAIERHLGAKLPLEKRPRRKGDVLATRADIGRAKKILGFTPRTNFEEGLRRTVEWFDGRKKYLR